MNTVSYMRDLRYDSPSYGAPPPPPPMNYQIPPFNGDSYRPDRDRDRDMPPSPNIPYYERERLDDRDFYRPGRNNTAPNNNNNNTSSNNNINNSNNSSSSIPDYDRYRARPVRPNWTSPAATTTKRDDSPPSSRRLDRDRPERIITDTTTSSERTSPVKEQEKALEKKEDQASAEELSMLDFLPHRKLPLCYSNLFFISLQIHQ